MSEKIIINGNEVTITTSVRVSYSRNLVKNKQADNGETKEIWQGVELSSEITNTYNNINTEEQLKIIIESIKALEVTTTKELKEYYKENIKGS